MNQAFEVGGLIPPPFAILSAERSDQTVESNLERMRALDQHLHALPSDVVYTVVGSYNGRTEAARLVLCQDQDSVFTQLERIAHRYGQESMLYVNKLGVAFYVLTMDNESRGKFIPAGRWRALDVNESVKRRNWTLDQWGTYYGTVG